MDNEHDTENFSNPIAEMMYNQEQTRGSRPFNIDDSDRFRIKKIFNNDDSSYNPSTMNTLMTNITEYNSKIESFLKRIALIFNAISNYDKNIKGLVELNKSFIDNNVPKQNELLENLNLSRNGLNATLTLEEINIEYKNFLKSCSKDLDIFFQSFGRRDDGSLASSLIVPIEQIQTHLNDPSVSKEDFEEFTKKIVSTNNNLTRLISRSNAQNFLTNNKLIKGIDITNKLLYENLPNTNTELAKITESLNTLNTSQTNVNTSMSTNQTVIQGLITSLEASISKVLSELEKKNRGNNATLGLARAIPLLKIPDEFIDPVTQELLVNPVNLAKCGHTISKDIADRLASSDVYYERVCPVCREPFPTISAVYFVNYALKEAIASFKKFNENIAFENLSEVEVPIQPNLPPQQDNTQVMGSLNNLAADVGRVNNQNTQVMNSLTNISADVGRVNNQNTQVMNSLTNISADVGRVGNQNIEIQNAQANLITSLSTMMNTLSNPFREELIKLATAMTTSNSNAILEMSKNVSQSIKPVMEKLAEQVSSNNRLNMMVSQLKNENTRLKKQPPNREIAFANNTYGTTSITSVPVTDENGNALQGIQDDNLIMDTNELQQTAERDVTPKYTNAVVQGDNRYLSSSITIPGSGSTTSKITPVSSAYNGLPGQASNISDENLKELPIPKIELETILKTINDSWKAQFEYLSTSTNLNVTQLNTKVLDLIKGMNEANNFAQLNEKYKEYMITVQREQHAYIENIITRVENNFVTKYEQVTEAYKSTLTSGMWGINPLTKDFYIMESFQKVIGSYKESTKAYIRDDVMLPLTQRLDAIATNIIAVSKSEQAVTKAMDSTNETIKKEIAVLNQNIVTLANNVNHTTDFTTINTSLRDILNSLEGNLSPTSTISTTIATISEQVTALNNLAIRITSETNIVPIVEFTSPIEGSPPPPPPEGGPIEENGNYAQILAEVQNLSEETSSNVAPQENQDFTVSSSSRIVLGERISTLVQPVDPEYQSEFAQSSNANESSTTIPRAIYQSQDEPQPTTEETTSQSQKIEINNIKPHKRFVGRYKGSFVDPNNPDKVSKDLEDKKKIDYQRQQKEKRNMEKNLARNLIDESMLVRVLSTDHNPDDVTRMVSRFSDPNSPLDPYLSKVLKRTINDLTRKSALVAAKEMDSGIPEHLMTKKTQNIIAAVDDYNNNLGSIQSTSVFPDQDYYNDNMQDASNIQNASNQTRKLTSLEEYLSTMNDNPQSIPKFLQPGQYEQILQDYNKQYTSSNNQPNVPEENPQEGDRVGSGVPKCSGCGKQKIESLYVHKDDDKDLNCSECIQKRGGMTLKRRIADSESMIPIKKHKTYEKSIKKIEQDKQSEKLRQHRIATSSLQYFDLEASNYFDNMNWFVRYSKSFVVSSDSLPQDALKRLAYIIGVSEHAPHKINSNIKANYNALAIKYLEKNNISNAKYFVPNIDKFESFNEIYRYIQQDPTVLYNYLI